MGQKKGIERREGGGGGKARVGEGTEREDEERGR